MKTPKPNPNEVQLTIFDLLARQEQPAIPEFHKTIRRVTIGGIVFFSVYDVFKHYGTTTSNPRMEWNRAKDRLTEQGFDVVSNVLLHQFEGRGQRKTPVASFQTFLRIAMVTSFKNWEGLREFMATAAHERIEETANLDLGVERAIARQIAILMTKRGMTSEQAHKHILRRQSSKVARNLTTDKLKFHVIDTINFAVFTDKAEYKPLFNRLAAEICQMTGVSDARDGMTTEALAFLEIAELTFARRIEAQGSITFQEACELMVSITAPLGLSIQAMERITGIDMATGQKLFKSQYDYE